MPKVSLYPKITELVRGEQIPFNDMMEKIKSGWKNEVTTLRNHIALGATEKEIAEEKAATLPYFTGSGIFSKRNDAGLIEHSGKIIIDFDKLAKHNINIKDAFDTLKRDKYTEYIFTSCSGTGLAVVVNIDPTKHLDSFLFLEKYYEKQYPQLSKAFDKSCKDISRPRFISHDPDLHSNTFFETVRLIDNSITVDSDEGRFEFAIRVFNKNHQYVEGQRHHYILLLGFWVNKCGVSEEYTLSEFLKRFNDKDPKEIDRIVQACYKNTHEFGTFAITKSVKEVPPEYSNAVKDIARHAHGMNEAGRHFNDTDVEAMYNKHYLISPEIIKGIFKNVFDKNKDAFGLDEKSDTEKVQVFLKRTYEIRVNSISRQTEYKKKNSSENFEVLNIHEIHRTLQIVKIKYSFDNLKHLLKSDFVKPYNPLIEYFNNLSPWDQQTDHIEQLASYVQTDDQEYWQSMFKKSFIRSIACSIGGRENRMIMTLFSPKQETGKTTFVRFLCPPDLKKYYSEAAIETGKDCEVGLCENFIWNLDELRLDSRTDQARFKAFVSTSSVKIRVWYSEFYQTFNRIVNFWSTTNKVQFLMGRENTRFLSFNVLSIDHNYNNIQSGVKNIDINKVWAQAWHLYKDGFDYSLNNKEKQVREKSNEQLLIDSPENDCIKKFFRKPIDKNRAQILTATEVYEKLAVLAPNVHKALNAQRVGYVLRDLGYEKKPRCGYYVEYNYKEENGTITMLSNEIYPDDNGKKLF